uniref:Uncharacterized protein n=1 Tax=uncultured marine virus TaxID=186617 RepID=A0A0F7L5Z1_9VIRU|nr:hypothetical protein [uncultured marine virus]
MAAGTSVVGNKRDEVAALPGNASDARTVGRNHHQQYQRWGFREWPVPLHRYEVVGNVGAFTVAHDGDSTQGEAWRSGVLLNRKEGRHDTAPRLRITQGMDHWFRFT